MTEKRSELALQDLVNHFLAATAEENAKLAHALENLDDEGRTNLGGILGRFDQKSRGELNPTERLLVCRILVRLRKPNTSSLVTLNKILDYLDLNANAKMDQNELELSIEILEIFSRAESDNDTLSERELEMLYAMLRHLDADDSHFLESHERAQLRDALRDPEVFLAEQKRSNPLLQEILGS